MEQYIAGTIISSGSQCYGKYAIIPTERLPADIQISGNRIKIEIIVLEAPYRIFLVALNKDKQTKTKFKIRSKFPISLYAKFQMI